MKLNLENINDPIARNSTTLSHLEETLLQELNKAMLKAGIHPGQVEVQSYGEETAYYNNCGLVIDASVDQKRVNEWVCKWTNRYAYLNNYRNLRVIIYDNESIKVQTSSFSIGD